MDLDAWLSKYNEKRSHSGKYCYGKTPMQTFLDAIPMTREKMIGYEAAARSIAGGCQTDVMNHTSVDKEIPLFSFSRSTS